MVKQIVIIFFVFHKALAFGQTYYSVPNHKEQKLTVDVPSSEKSNTIIDSIYQYDISFVEFGSVEFNLGVSIPAGDFSNSNHINPSSGYAKEGYSIGANLSYKLTKQLDMMLCYSRQLNVFDEKAFSINALAGVKNYTIQTNANWVNHFVVAGVSNSIYLDENNILIPRFLVGFNLSKSPKFETFPVSPPSNTVSPRIYSGESTVAFAVRAGAGLRKNLNKQFFLTLNSDIFLSKVSYNISKQYFQNQASNNHRIAIVSVSASLGFRLYK
jgi:hypothetical protein